jgi:hypothetical protein
MKIPNGTWTHRGTVFEFQPVQQTWWLELSTRYKMSSDSPQTVEYIDDLIKNVVISPIEVKNGGVAYLDSEECPFYVSVAKLTKEIERFLDDPIGYSGSVPQSKAK